MADQPIKSAIIAVKGLTLDLDEAALLTKYNPLGVSIFARNVKDKPQLKKLIEDIKTALDREDAVIAVDQEGGRVRRLAEPNWRSYASQQTLGRLNEQASQWHAELIAKDLREMGINLNYAPVLDVKTSETTPALMSRCFADDPEVVAKLGNAMCQAYLSNGVCPCMKHMPGSGRFRIDPHLSLPVIDEPLAELAKDFYPFKSLNSVPCGMTGHFVIPEIDAQNPITQSGVAINSLIRGEIGFDGFLISDALDMKALKGSFGEKAKRAFDAGCDAVCMYSAEPKDMIDVCENAKILADKSLIRFEKIKKVFKNSLMKKNWNDISVQYDDLIGSVETYCEAYDATEVLKKMEK